MLQQRLEAFADSRGRHGYTVVAQADQACVYMALMRVCACGPMPCGVCTLRVRMCVCVCMHACVSVLVHKCDCMSGCLCVCVYVRVRVCTHAAHGCVPVLAERACTTISERHGKGIHAACSLYIICTHASVPRCMAVSSTSGLVLHLVPASHARLMACLAAESYPRRPSQRLG